MYSTSNPISIMVIQPYQFSFPPTPPVTPPTPPVTPPTPQMNSHSKNSSSYLSTLKHFPQKKA